MWIFIVENQFQLGGMKQVTKEHLITARANNY